MGDGACLIACVAILAPTALAAGTFLSRQKVPRAGAAGKLGETLALRDFNVGADVVILGRRFHVVGCDDKTVSAVVVAPLFLAPLR